MNGPLQIHFACDNGNANTVKSLLEEGCDIEAQDEKNWRPIHIACAKGYIDIVKLLLIGKCDIEACDKDNYRPIHFATQLGSVEIVKLLIEHQCDINALTNDKKTPLSIAMQCNHMQLINIIKYELFKKDLVLKIKQASEVKCKPQCNHKSCPRNLMSTASQNKRVIGTGAFGKVYEITDSNSNFKYALKLIKMVSEDVKKEVKGLENDIDKYRDRIKHPRIIEYYGSVLCPPNLHIFMEFVPKGSLDEEIQNTGFLPQLRVARYTKQILEGLEFLHGKKIIHRDIKPQNILIDESDGIKLCDFGLSKALATISLKRSSSTNNEEQNKDERAHTECGTYCYMAPEIITGEGHSYSVDIWSLGASIVHMLTGYPPYSNLNRVAAMFKLGNEKKIVFEPREPISDNMNLFIEETLNPDQKERATAKALLQFLNDKDMV